MPKIFEYRGFDFVIYPEDHEPPHCYIAGMLISEPILIS